MSSGSSPTSQQVIAAFRRLPVDEQRKAFLAIRAQMPDTVIAEMDSLDGDEAVELEARSQQLRSRPESGVTFKAFEEELKNRFGDDL